MTNRHGDKNADDSSAKDPPADDEQAEDAQDDDGEEGSEARRKGHIPLWEWIVAALGALLVMGTIGFMLYRAISGDSSPPDVTVRLDSVSAVTNGYLVQVVITNDGRITAAGLTVEGDLKEDGESVETSSVTIDYVPSQSNRRAGLFFTVDPRQFELDLRATGYQQP